MFGEVRLPLFEYTDFHQTNSDLYIFGYTAVEKTGKLLRISRSNIKHLEVYSDEQEYTIPEYEKELKRIQSTSANLQPVCKAYGILGCFRFLAGYYLLVLTARQFVGSICGHGLFAVKDVQLIPLPHGHTRASGREQQAERRYRKLITSGLDLSKDFLVSYSYNLCHTLQTNLTKPLSDPFDSRFVWNEYLTRDFRPKVSTQWVLPLIHGYLEQKVLSVFGAPVQFTLIARRSRFFAGTRWRKRGINGMGHVANDVETEQIVQTGRDGATRRPLLSSMVQMRGSIPLYWFQEATGPLLSMKPSIKLPPLDPLYDSTTLHFDDLSERYGDPVVVLNLVKTHERVKHESVLGDEFKNAVKVLNEKMRDPRHAIMYHTFDFTYVFKRKGFEHVYPELKPLLDSAYRLSGVFVFNPHGRRHRYGHSEANDVADNGGSAVRYGSAERSQYGGNKSGGQGFAAVAESMTAMPGRGGVHLRLQKGLLRTNCIDCLDRTNVAQCIYGLQVLGVQLQELDLSDESEVDFGSSMAMEIMSMYERMGNCLAMQYGGSQAHSQYFHRQRGDWNAKVQSRDLVTTLTRIYNNNLNDAEKQQAMNLFLGNFVPQPGKPAVWELGSDKHLHAGPSTSPLHYDPEAMMREGDSDQDDAESADADSPRSMAPASAVLPGTVGIAAVASVDLASMTSGSLAALDAGGALDAGADSSQRLRDASLSESQALALEVTSKVDGILAQCSDLDRAVKEVDLGVDEEPLSGVHSKRVTWSLARMPMFRGQQKGQEPKTAKLHSFDALRSAPQGCPVSVRMHRDTATRSHSQPLLNFFRNALGLSQRQPGHRSPRDQSYGLDGRSEVSRDLSTTHALSRTLSFLSCGVSENISPTAAHSHTSTFVTHASGHADELLSTRTGPEPAVHPSVPGLPRTRIAGLPLFLHADVAAVPKALPGVPSAAILRGRLGAETIPDPLPIQAAGRWKGALSTRSSTRGMRHSATEVIRPDSPPVDISGRLSGDSVTNIASAPLLGGSPQISMMPQGGHPSSHLTNASPHGPSRPRRQRMEGDALTSAFQAAGGFAAMQRQSSAHANLTTKAATMPRSRTVGSSPGALSSSFADVGLEGDASVYTQVMEHMLMRHADGAGMDTAVSGALSDIPESAEVARLLVPGAASLMPVVDETYLRKRSVPGRARGGGAGVVPLFHDDPVSRGLHDTLRTWVQQDGKLGRSTPSSGTASPGLGDAMRSCISPIPSSELRMGASMLARTSAAADAVGDIPRDGADTAALADAWRGAELSLVSETAALESEFQRWLDQYTAVFMDPREEARLVEEYSNLYGSQGYPAQPILPHVL